MERFDIEIIADGDVSHAPPDQTFLVKRWDSDTYMKLGGGFTDDIDKAIKFVGAAGLERAKGQARGCKHFTSDDWYVISLEPLGRVVFSTATG